ncbi:MAG: hypothetical protein KJ834_05420 [Alphaproteobacteria bacterium]|nr:hypothetical protein [Alphaproteobacteria bacterium]
MSNYVKSIWAIFASFIVGTMLLAFAVMGWVLNILGALAIPEDTESEVMPMLDLFNYTPPWAFGLAYLAGVILATWLLAYGVKNLVSQQKLEVSMPKGHMTSDQAKYLVDWAAMFEDRHNKEILRIENEIKSLPVKVGHGLTTAQGELTLRVDNLADEMRAVSSRLNEFIKTASESQAMMNKTLISQLTSQNQSVLEVTSILDQELKKYLPVLADLEPLERRISDIEPAVQKIIQLLGKE